MGESGAAMLLTLLELAHALTAAAPGGGDDEAAGAEGGEGAQVTVAFSVGDDGVVAVSMKAEPPPPPPAAAAAAAAPAAAAASSASASASASASSPAPAWFPGALMSAGGTVCEAGAALLADHMCLSGAYFAAASTALAKVDAATAPHAATNVLAAQQAALAEARATFEAMLAANSAEVRALTLTLTPPRPKPKPNPSLTKPNQVRALTDEAMHHLLPLCALVPVAE